MTSTARRITSAAAELLGSPLPIAVRSWDGSEVPAPIGSPLEGPDAPRLVFRSQRALRRLVWAPGELGLAEAYISGDLDVEGDLLTALGAIWAPSTDTPAKRSVRNLLPLLGDAVRLRAIGTRPPRPGQAAKLRGRRHTQDRDRAAIAHHYDVGNEFYELLLDDSMAYSCGYYTQGPAGSLVDAQQAKLDLICRKLGLKEGQRHLDVGCGWGSLICHAAAHYGTRSVGVTLSRQQYEYVTKRVADAGLADLVTVVHADYRDLDKPEILDRIGGSSFDVVTTIEMGEHVGEQEYPAFAELLRDRVRPGGRILVQQMSRGENAPGGGAFIETYIAPDMHMKPLSVTLGHFGRAGLEVRDVHALREHYAWTCDDWTEILESHWERAVAMLGETGARIWRLYLVGASLAFTSGRMGVDQILLTRPHPDGSAELPAGRAVWERS
ncbi:MAG: cyclopropane-fatty-acyl-phospholipid synthase family protein [Nakamurella sp.]